MNSDELCVGKCIQLTFIKNLKEIFRVCRPDMYAYVYACASGIQKRLSDPFELELTGLCHLPGWVLGMKLWASARVASSLKPFLQPHPLLS